MRSRVKAGENASIILERGALYSFLKNTNMVDFDGVQKKKGDNSSSFEYHPSGNKEFAQLWAPFYQEFKLDKENGDSLVGGKLILKKVFINSLKSYKKRFYGLKTHISSIQIDDTQLINPAGKLWQDSHVYSSTIFKNKQKNIEKRGGEYVLFNSTHLNKK